MSGAAVFDLIGADPRPDHALQRTRACLSRPRCVTPGGGGCAEVAPRIATGSGVAQRFVFCAVKPAASASSVKRSIRLSMDSPSRSELTNQYSFLAPSGTCIPFGAIYDVGWCLTWE